MIQGMVLASVWLLVPADEPTASVGLKIDRPEAQLGSSIDRGLQVLQKAAASYPRNRNCFSCHHQTLPMLAMVAARESKVPIDAELLQAQAEFTHRSFRERIEPMKEGRGIGGQAMTVAYGLWTLALVDWEPDETTEAMVTHLLKTQKEDGRWGYQTSRPPLEASYITCTVLSAYYLERYASESQRGVASAAVAKAKTWLESAPLECHEDRVFHLWGLKLLGDDDAEHFQAARQRILKAQRDDGGWAQLDDMASDAYATGQALFILQATGLPTSHPTFERGAQFLLKTQCEDGSWFVKTRSKPIQVFFDNGDPHGEHQFISIPATSWAVAALGTAVRSQTVKGSTPCLE